MKKSNTKKQATSGSNIGNLCRRTALSLMVVAIAAATFTASAQGFGREPAVKLTTMTANAYIGAEFDAITSLDPTDPDYEMKLVTAVTATFGQVLASDPPVRLAGLAREIAMRKPQLIAVQELTSLQTAPLVPTAAGPVPGQFAVVYDYTKILLQALADLGLHYEVAVSVQEADIIAPMLLDVQSQTLGFGRMIDHDALLVRVDSPNQLEWSNPQTGNYAHNLQFQSITVYRGWCSIDVTTTANATMRIICTHLEEETSPEIQVLQATELVTGPAKAEMPVMILGDLNADPLHRNGSPAFDVFQEAGFKDTWATVYSRKSTGGLTWGHDPELADPSHKFTWRIDLVLYKGPHISPTGIQVLDVPLGRTQPPLWASDHAAVSAQFNIGKKMNGRGQSVGR